MLTWVILGNYEKAMRKLFGFLLVTCLALGGVYITWPDKVAARWALIYDFAKRQISVELATLERIESGELKIGVSPAAKPGLPPLQASPAPSISILPPAPKKARETRNPLPKIASPAESKPELRQQAGLPQTPPAPSEATPEAALGSILKHETRENQAKEETFWTEERIQEALKNGEPKKGSAPCIAFCDKKNTVIEINMPKTPPAQP